MKGKLEEVAIGLAEHAGSLLATDKLEVTDVKIIGDRVDYTCSIPLEAARHLGLIPEEAYQSRVIPRPYPHCKGCHKVLEDCGCDGFQGTYYP